MESIVPQHPSLTGAVIIFLFLCITCSAIKIHIYLRRKHCQIDTLLSKAVIEKMYTNDFCGRISGFSKTPFLTHLYNFGSKMHSFACF